ncbi:TonB system transport protein ExbD [Bradyrhizobium sp. URHD0069]|uniref:TonB system transport protein ExbD n=1 Tax=Bradyrhizobium sp. URHD0069 TaxID=1380355 RepID=UPI000497047F|nr:TonB system transport protein ExbD [Bradyrhizobium sp. URHD0069]
MAAQLQQASSDDEMQQVSEINVTPFIDVILVLLIIFMIAAPLATVDVAVDLPASTVKRQPRPDKPIFVTLKADRTLAIGETPLSRDGLAASLNSVTSSDHSKRLFVRADKTVPYGEVMTLMNDLRSAGYLKIALVGLESGGAQ